MFFKLLLDDEKMPVVRMMVSTKNRLSVLIHNLHDKYSLSPDGTPVLPVEFDMTAVNKTIHRWLKEQYKKSVLTGDEARDSFRRRDAVNGFRAGLLATAIYHCMGRRIGPKECKIINDFAVWVATYALDMHLLKYGKELIRIGNDRIYVLDRSKRKRIQVAASAVIRALDFQEDFAPGEINTADLHRLKG